MDHIYGALETMSEKNITHITTMQGFGGTPSLDGQNF